MNWVFHNFSRLCELHKANLVVYKNRPCEMKILGQVFFCFFFPLGLLYLNRFLCVCLLCQTAIFSVDFLSRVQLLSKSANCGLGFLITHSQSLFILICPSNPWCYLTISLSVIFFPPTFSPSQHQEKEMATKGYELGLSQFFEAL